MFKISALIIGTDLKKGTMLRRRNNYLFFYLTKNDRTLTTKKGVIFQVGLIQKMLVYQTRF